MPTHNFIVTGGCGFIGSHLVEALLLHDQNVLVVDDMSRGSHMCDHKRIKYLHQEVQKVIPSGTFDAIFHLAATPRIRLSQEHPYHTISNNISSTTAVCEWARRMNIPLFFAASSSTQFIDRMQNPYTFSKDVCDDILELYRKLYGIKYHVLHFYNVYGPREADYSQYSTVIRSFKKCIEKNEPLRIFGSGKKERDFTHVFDVIDGIMKLLTEKRKPQDIHLGSGNPRSISEIADAFDHPVIYEFDRKGEADRTICDEPYIEPEYDVIRYCKEWKNNFLLEKTMKKTEQEFKEIEERHAKIDSR